MTGAVLTLAWLVLAHLVADFVLQTGGMVRAKNGRGTGAAGGLFLHGAVVAITLVPVGLAWGGPGWAYLVWSAVLHVAIDRTKIVLTRRAATAALDEAQRRQETPQPPDHLGRAWTSTPAALFLADQLAHLAVAGLGWAIFLAGSAIQPAWADAVNSVLGSLDRTGVHRVVGALVVLVALAIANGRAASIWVSVLVRPVEDAAGDVRWGDRATGGRVTVVDSGETVSRPAARRWSLRVGPFDARLEEAAVPAADAASTAQSATASSRPTQVARVGAAIGILERALIVVFVLTGTEAAIGFVVAAKTLARFRQLDDRDFAEYYLLGTLASVAVAIVTGLVGRAALSVLLA
ncbi:MAG TPA: DUF3307 domain-containing protein [Candidatus Limnocylindrales bacterium]|jgi:hypothetical protein